MNSLFWSFNFFNVNLFVPITHNSYLHLQTLLWDFLVKWVSCFTRMIFGKKPFMFLSLM